MDTIKSDVSAERVDVKSKQIFLIQMYTVFPKSFSNMYHKVD